MKFRKPSEVGCASPSAFVGFNLGRVVEGIRRMAWGLVALIVLVLAPVLWPLGYLYQNFYGHARAVAQNKKARRRYMDEYRQRLAGNDN